MCQKTHLIWQCAAFKALSPADRWQEAMKLNLCFSCLSNQHRATACRYDKVCDKNGCKNSHHWLLHNPDRHERSAKLNTKPPTSSPGGTNQNSKTSTSNSAQQAHSISMKVSATPQGQIHLRTIPVRLSCLDKEITVVALVDDGSSTSFLAEDAAKRLGIEGPIQPMSIQVAGGGELSLDDSMIVEPILHNVTKSFSMKMQLRTIKNVTAELTMFDWKADQALWAHLKDIDFPKVPQRATVELLIGADHAILHDALEERRGKQVGAPIARRTRLGWTCIGRSMQPAKGPYSHHAAMCFITNDIDHLSELDKTMRKFWEIEEPDERDKPVISKTDQEVLEKTINTLQYDGTRYTVATPWKDENKTIEEKSKLEEKINQQLLQIQ